MKLKRFLRYQEFKWVYWLALIFVLSILWSILWSSRVTIGWWQHFHGTVSDAVFFRWEEFFALNSHGNTTVAHLGFLLTIGFGVALQFVPGLAEKAKWSSFVIVALAAFMLLPCLCHPREKTRRMLCQSKMKALGHALNTYAAEYGEFPPALGVTMPDGKLFWEADRWFDPAETTYHGAGKKPSDGIFLLVEDGYRTHAGDLRHRLMSDGAVSAVHLWENGNGGGDAR